MKGILIKPELFHFKKAAVDNTTAAFYH